MAHYQEWSALELEQLERYTTQFILMGRCNPWSETWWGMLEAMNGALTEILKR